MSPAIHPVLAKLPAPRCSFTSDNSAAAHPSVMSAMLAANNGHALAYGADPWSEQTQQRFKQIFGADSETFLVWGGSGANVMALASLLQAGECVVCSDQAHIAVAETGAPERALGAKLLLLPSVAGKIHPEQVAALGRTRGSQHHPQPGILSLTQATEMGSVYSAAELQALCHAAHQLGMRVHLDGARIANACAALGGTLAALRSISLEAGVDVLCFGGTKAGLIGGEAVIYFHQEHARRAKYVRKQVNQLPSKMRYVAAQFNALLEDDLWLTLAAHANHMAQRLYLATRDIVGLHYAQAPVTNGLFPTLPAACIAPLAAWCHFWEWDTSQSQVRWMTAWDTSEADVDHFAAGVTALLQHYADNGNTL
jgi:threonine aldolase